jgi:hypothetical protein
MAVWGPVEGSVDNAAAKLSAADRQAPSAWLHVPASTPGLRWSDSAADFLVHPHAKLMV